MHEMLYLLNCIQISILSIASGAIERLFPTLALSYNIWPITQVTNGATQYSERLAL